jgi:arabinose-5-phosphate isomerase
MNDEAAEGNTMPKATTQILIAARDAISREAAVLLAVADHLDDTFLQTVELLAACQGKVFVSGSGTSGAVARRMAHLLSVCGTPAVFMPAMDALHGSMGAIVSGDIVIAISRGGETTELSDLARRVQRRGVPVIALTSAPRSALATIANLTVVFPDGESADPGGVIAMGSTLAVAAWGDALAYVLMRRSGYGWDEVLETHPAGAVGQLRKLPDALPGLDGEKPPR